MPQVLGMGDNVCDIYLHTQTMYPGGQALNFGVYATQLGARADFLGVFGDDAIAAHNKETLHRLGVGTTHCRSYPGPNGYARVTLVNGDRIFVSSNRGGVLQQHPIVLDRGDLAYLEQMDLIHVSNNGFVDGELPKLAALPSLRSYDFSYRWTEQDRVARVCPHIHFGFLSCGSVARQEAEAVCRSLYAAGCGTVVATRGGEGALLFDGCQVLEQRPKLVQQVDTLGAGDSFATAFLLHVLRELQVQGRAALSAPAWRAAVYPSALQAAAEFAARTCLVPGAFGHGAPVPPALQHLCREETPAGS